MKSVVLRQCFYTKISIVLILRGLTHSMQLVSFYTSYEYQKTRGELTKEMAQQRNYGKYELVISIVWKLEILLKVAFRTFLKININSDIGDA